MGRVPRGKRLHFFLYAAQMVMSDEYIDAH
jgi:hypothetical protein